MARSAARSRGFIAAATFTVKPSISGTAQSGQTLTGATGTIVGATLASRQWFRSVSPIAGATAATYVQQAADVGHTISYEVRATNGVTARSARTAVVMA